MICQQMIKLQQTQNMVCKNFANRITRKNNKQKIFPFRMGKTPNRILQEASKAATSFSKQLLLLAII